MISKEIIPEVLSISSSQNKLKGFPICEDLSSAEDASPNAQTAAVEVSFSVDPALKLTDRREGKVFKLLDPGVVGMEVPLGRLANVTCSVSFSEDRPRLSINRTLSRFGKITLGNVHSVGWLLRDFCNVQLLNKGYALLHGAALASDSACVLLIGLSNTGKTSTVKELVSNGDAKTFGDDLFVIDGEHAFACPYTAFNMSADLFPKARDRALQRARRGIPFYEYLGPTPRVTLQDFFGKALISRPRKIDTVLFLRRSAKHSESRLERQKAAEMLIASNAAEFTFSTNSLFRAHDFLTRSTVVSDAIRAEEQLLTQTCGAPRTTLVDGSIDDFIRATRAALGV